MTIREYIKIHINKLKTTNKTNSTLTIRCTAKGKCASRYTTLCQSCEYNIGISEDKNYYKSR